MFSTRKSTLKHIRLEKDCRESEYRLPTHNDEFVCYLDDAHFKTRLDLFKHIVFGHSE